MSYDDFDIDKARELREKAKDGFVKESRKGLVRTLLASLPLLFLAGLAGARWAQVSGPEFRFYYALLMLAAVLLNVSVWRAYGLDSRLLFLLKEIKQLRVDFLSAGRTSPEMATGGAESVSGWKLDILKPGRFAMVLVALILAAGGLAVIANLLTDSYQYSFGGQEVTEVHILPNGAFRVCARISITRCAENVASIPLRLPQPGAVIESVTLGGREIPFEVVPGKEDTYAIFPGMPENALMNAMIEVVWSPPEADIKSRGEARSFSLRLRGIIPFTAYAANAVIDEGAPYQFAYPDKASCRSLNLFWSKRPPQDYNGDPMGTCDVAIQPISNTP